ncbi:leucine-rich repeat domain-containing protein [Flavobacterium sp. 3-210]
MNWDNYLLEEKAPYGEIAHLGVLEGNVSEIYDLSKVDNDTRVLSLSTPPKKIKKTYTNFSSLIGNEKIEAICVNDIDKERISVFSTLPNLKYLQISVNRQEEIPDLSSLKSIEVLILANMTRIQNIDFVRNMKNLKTLYIYEINNLYDLTPISTLINLQELAVDHGKMSGTGKGIKSITPLKLLEQLKYLRLSITIEDESSDLTALYELKKLKEVMLLPRYLKKGSWERLKEQLPLIR